MGGAGRRLEEAGSTVGTAWVAGGAGSCGVCKSSEVGWGDWDLGGASEVCEGGAAGEGGRTGGACEEVVGGGIVACRVLASLRPADASERRSPSCESISLVSVSQSVSVCRLVRCVFVPPLQATLAPPAAMCLKGRLSVGPAGRRKAAGKQERQWKMWRKVWDWMWAEQETEKR